MYNTDEQQFDKIKFIGNMTVFLVTLTLKSPIITDYRPETWFERIQYQLACIFAGDLDFLANFLGQQGASAKWLCMHCLASQDKSAVTFHLSYGAPRFHKQKGINSLKFISVSTSTCLKAKEHKQ